MTERNRPLALVTGAGRGIGAATAKLLAADGYRVIVNYAKNRAAAEATITEIKAHSGEALLAQGNVGKEQDILRMFEAIDREAGSLKVLVNNAGITGGFAHVADVKAEMLEELFAVNISGSILCAREAVQRMSTAHGGSGGSIVNISSLVARTGGAGEWVHYAASKGAINTFTIGLAREVATEGIRVNAVSPGLVDTDIHADSGDAARLKRMAPSIPMKRAGTANEVAQAIAWLVSDAASYVTGTILEVGGGR